MAAYTTTLFLSSVERQSFSPANQATFSTAEILSLGDEVMQTSILPALLAVREEFLVTSLDYTITANQSSYLIPQRSVGMTIRELQIVDANGNVRNLPRISLDKLHLMSSISSTPDSFYLRGDNIILTPTPSSTTGTLRVYYSIRAGNLVQTTATAVISAINTSTNVVTVTTIPSTWSTGSIFDLIQGTGAHQYLSIDLTSTLVSGSDITLPSLPSNLAVGDYISLTGESSLIQLPPDFRPTLATLTAAEMLIAMNQPNGEKLLAKGIRSLDIAQKMVAPRVIGEEELITPDWS